MTQLPCSPSRLVYCLTWTLAALMALAGGAEGAQQTEVAQAQPPSPPAAQDASVAHQQSVQQVSDALGRRLDQMMASQRPLPLR